MGFRNGDEGEWINLIDDVFHLFHLIPRNDTVDDIQVLTAVIAHPADKGNPATQIVGYFWAISSGLDVTIRKPFPAKPPSPIKSITRVSIRIKKRVYIAVRTSWKTTTTVVRTMASTINMSFPILREVYLLKMRARISVPPVVPPALKMIPSPKPSTTPEAIQASRISPLKGFKDEVMVAVTEGHGLKNCHPSGNRKGPQ